MIMKMTFRHLVNRPVSTLLTLFAVTLALAMLGSFWTLKENFDRVKVRRPAPTQAGSAAAPAFTVSLDPKLGAEEVETLKRKLLEDKRIEKIEVISSEEAVKTLEQEYGEAATRAFSGESLPVQMRLQFSETTLSRGDFQTFKNHLRSLSGVLEVDDGSTFLRPEALNVSERVFNWASVLLVAVFLVVALLVSHLIRLAFESSRQEIETMKVLGASKTWIFLPLLLEGLIFGVGGAVLALIGMNVGLRIFVARLSGFLLPRGFEITELSLGATWQLALLGIASSVLGAVMTWPLVSRPPKEV